MSEPKPILLHGKPVGGGAFPLICTPLVGRTRDAVLAEVDAVLPKKPDVLEWRVDFFEALGDTAHVIDTARAIRDRVGPIPVMFTRRSSIEGGEKIALAEPQVVQLYVEVCASRLVDLIDYETVNAAEDFGRLRAVSREHGIALIGSYHNFQGTPDAAALAAKFALAHRLGGGHREGRGDAQGTAGRADAARRRRYDASQSLPIPLISMSMGPYGSLSRMVGFVYGSALDLGRRQEQLGPGPGADRGPARCRWPRSARPCSAADAGPNDHRRRNPPRPTRAAPALPPTASNRRRRYCRWPPPPKSRKASPRSSSRNSTRSFARARKALAIIETYDQARVDRLCQAVAWAVANKQTFTRLVDMGIEESGLGDAVSRMGKRMKIRGVLRDALRQKSVGIIEEMPGEGHRQVRQAGGDHRLHRADDQPGPDARRQRDLRHQGARRASSSRRIRARRRPRSRPCA